MLKDKLYINRYSLYQFRNYMSEYKMISKDKETLLNMIDTRKYLLSKGIKLKKVIHSINRTHKDYISYFYIMYLVEHKHKIICTIDSQAHGVDYYRYSLEGNNINF
jgi:hypothetical protein